MMVCHCPHLKPKCSTCSAHKLAWLGYMHAGACIFTQAGWLMHPHLSLSAASLLAMKAKSSSWSFASFSTSVSSSMALQEEQSQQQKGELVVNDDPVQSLALVGWMGPGTGCLDGYIRSITGFMQRRRGLAAFLPLCALFASPTAFCSNDPHFTSTFVLYFTRHGMIQ
jgi:hypothetical protein